MEDRSRRACGCGAPVSMKCEGLSRPEIVKRAGLSTCIKWAKMQKAGGQVTCESGAEDQVPNRSQLKQMATIKPISIFIAVILLRLGNCTHAVTGESPAPNAGQYSDLNGRSGSIIPGRCDIDKDGYRMTEGEVEVITRDINGAFKENDISKYEIESHPESFYIRFHHYTECTQINYCKNTVWKHDPAKFGADYPIYIFFQRSHRKIHVNYPTILLIYEYEGGAWNLKSESRMDHVRASTLTIITADDPSGINAKENDTAKYDVARSDYVVIYDFKKDSICTEIKWRNNTVWKYYPNTAARGLPRAIYFHTDLSMIFIDFRDDSSLYTCNDKGCKLVITKDLKGFTRSEIKIFTEKPSDPTKSIENDESQYETKPLGYGYIFNFKNKAKCTEFRYGERSLWTRGFKSGEEYPSAIYVNFYFKMIAIKFPKHVLIYMKPDRWRFVYKSEFENLSEADIQIVTEDDSNTKINKINDTTKYEIARYPFSYAFAFNLKHGSRCTKVMFKNRNVWKYNPNKMGQNYPSTVYFNKNLKMMIISSPKYFYVYIKLSSWINVFNSIDKKFANVYLLFIIPYILLALGLTIVLLSILGISIFYLKRKSKRRSIPIARGKIETA